VRVIAGTRPFDDATPLLADPAALRRAAAERGYLYLPGLVRRGPVEMLRRRVLAACAAAGVPGGPRAVRPGAARPAEGSPAWLALQARVAADPAFRALADEPSLVDVLATLFDAPPCGGRGDVCRVVPPGASATPPHQDGFFLRANAWAESERTWAAWIALVDCPPDLGGIAVLPGSHRPGLLPHIVRDAGAPAVDVPPDAVWATSAVRAGDVVLVGCLTVHRGLGNATRDRVRISVDFRYQPGPRALAPAGAATPRRRRPAR
jgi:hypothetical protein